METEKIILIGEPGIGKRCDYAIAAHNSMMLSTCVETTDTLQNFAMKIQNTIDLDFHSSWIKTPIKPKDGRFTPKKKKRKKKK